MTTNSKKKGSDDLKKIHLENHILDLQQRITNIESKGKIFYKDSSFWVSLIALLASVFSIVYSIITIKNEKKDNSYSSNVNSIINQIDDIKSYDHDYILQQANTSIDDEAKNALKQVYYSKLNELTEDIERKMTPKIINSLESSVLDDYARYLDHIGKIEKAINIDLIALNKCKNNYSKIAITRHLAFLYAFPSDSQNQQKSRLYRKEDINIQKSYPGEIGAWNLIESFLLWAKQEFVFFKNKEYANSLLDSAVGYTKTLEENNPKKKDIVTRINRYRDHYNDIFNIHLSSSNWIVVSNKHKIGTAHISCTNNTYHINIDTIENGKLQKGLSASGNFIEQRKIQFYGTVNYLQVRNTAQPVKDLKTNQVRPEIVSEAIPQQRVVILELEIKGNDFIQAKCYQLKQPVEIWELNLSTNF
jgi:hypothetical protein